MLPLIDDSLRYAAVKNPAFNSTANDTAWLLAIKYTRIATAVKHTAKYRAVNNYVWRQSRRHSSKQAPPKQPQRK
jgi:hypothetical protein